MNAISKNSIYQPLLSPATFPAHTYSLMKHGCVSSRAHFSKVLYECLANILDPNKKYRITASPFVTVPNTANQLLDDMLLTFRPKNFSRTYLRRKSIMPADFASLTEPERNEAASRLEFDYVGWEFYHQSVVVIDDIYVTGTHQRALTSVLGEVVKEIQYFYLADLSGGLEAEIENTINRVAVKSILDVLPLRVDPSFRYNSRVLKILFLSPEDEFRTFLGLLLSAEKELLLRMAQNEGFESLDDQYRKRYQLMQSLLLHDYSQSFQGLGYR